MREIESSVLLVVTITVVNQEFTRFSNSLEFVIGLIQKLNRQILWPLRPKNRRV